MSKSASWVSISGTWCDETHNPVAEPCHVPSPGISSPSRFSEVHTTRGGGVGLYSPGMTVSAEPAFSCTSDGCRSARALFAGGLISGSLTDRVDSVLPRPSTDALRFAPARPGDGLETAQPDSTWGRRTGRGRGRFLGLRGGVCEACERRESSRSMFSTRSFAACAENHSWVSASAGVIRFCGSSSRSLRRKSSPGFRVSA